MYTRSQELLLLILVTILVIFSYISVDKGIRLRSPLSLPKGATPRLFSLPQEDFRIDINTVDWRELDLLPGIGPVLAIRIIEYRETHGPFKQIEDLLTVKSITPRVFNKIKSYITIHP